MIFRRAYCASNDWSKVKQNSKTLDEIFQCSFVLSRSHTNTYFHFSEHRLITFNCMETSEQQFKIYRPKINKDDSKDWRRFTWIVNNDRRCWLKFLSMRMKSSASWDSRNAILLLLLASRNTRGEMESAPRACSRSRAPFQLAPSSQCSLNLLVLSVCS